MKPRTILVVLVIIAVLSLAIPLLLFLAKFWGLPISADPADWSAFGQYYGGIAGPLIGIVNVAVLICLAFAVYRLESQRERELVRPFAYVDTGDYEDDIYVRIQNLGLGPMRITKCECYPLDKPEKKVADLVKLMPNLGGYLWNTFTIGGPASVVPAGGETVLVKLTGSDEQDGFPDLRDRVRKALGNVVVLVHYEDIFGNRFKPTGGVLAAFSRHDN